MTEPKTSLTFEEKITCAFMHYVRGVSQQDIAIMMGGVNSGRVNEACQAIRKTLTPPGTEPKLYRDADLSGVELIDTKPSAIWKGSANG